MTTTFTVCLSMFFAGPATAGLGTTTGREWKLWTLGHYGVILAKVVSVEPVPAQPREHRAVLEPLATVAGSFDPSERQARTFRVFISQWGTTITTAPPKGAIIMAVVRTGVLAYDERIPSDWIVPDICKFMPEDKALVVIKGLDDPRVLETLRKIQDARAHPNPSPYPTTRPASGAKPAQMNDGK